MTIDPSVINQICTFVMSADQTNDKSIEIAAEHYAQACEKVNERLDLCKLFLKSGHRTQALRFAEQQPSLQWSVEQLKLRGMVDLWKDAIASFGWERCQPLKSEILNLLEDAYIAEKEVGELIQEYREKSLARAPLSDRLLLVRQLANKDLTNPTWLADIEEFEQALMRELAARGRRALSNSDLDELIEVVQQNDSQDWTVELPQDFQNFLSKAVPIVYRKYTIPRLVTKFKQARRRNHLDGMLEIRTKIYQHFELAKSYSSNFRVKETVASEFKRLIDELSRAENRRKMKAFQYDLRLLQNMLGGQHHREQIEEAFAQAQSHEIPIPPLVVAQMENCFANEKSDKQLTAIAISSLIFLVVVLLVLAFLLYSKLS